MKKPKQITTKPTRKEKLYSAKEIRKAYYAAAQRAFMSQPPLHWIIEELRRLKK